MGLLLVCFKEKAKERDREWVIRSLSLCMCPLLMQLLFAVLRFISWVIISGFEALLCFLFFCISIHSFFDCFSPLFFLFYLQLVLCCFSVLGRGDIKEKNLFNSKENKRSETISLSQAIGGIYFHKQNALLCL